MTVSLLTLSRKNTPKKLSFLIASEVEPSTLLNAKFTALLPTPKLSTKIDSFLRPLES